MTHMSHITELKNVWSHLVTHINVIITSFKDHYVIITSWSQWHICNESCIMSHIIQIFNFSKNFFRIFHNDLPAFLHYYYGVLYTWIESSRPPQVHCIVKNLKNFPKNWFLRLYIAIWVDSVWIIHLKRVLPPGNMLNRGWKCLQLKASGRFSRKKYLFKT